MTRAWVGPVFMVGMRKWEFFCVCFGGVLCSNVSSIIVSSPIPQRQRQAGLPLYGCHLNGRLNNSINFFSKWHKNVFFIYCYRTYEKRLV
ncbi:hypothetical protein BDV38DRAFT_175465 [Aspergillus pseudotamarii]|uniref:Uncharacterized protein n=1 Tax=Aspergillus pseudotamarii TaxID=132259 RepID=A0A5N6T6J4_ASPPS|nr:uncharacterized protein BDV38DRAFT_175465 [Aspergillus pseudotamarii]KAE8141958.1 hypothetical protein BDV38DRAFT_175465 [Aspergillus pseudotamarii]